MATSTDKKAQKAQQAQAQEQSSAPAPALAALAIEEEIGKAQRVYADISLDIGGESRKARVTDADDPSRFYALQRETRADGSTGPLLLAIGTRRKTGETVVRVDAGELERARSAMLRAGLRLFPAE